MIGIKCYLESDGSRMDTQAIYTSINDPEYISGLIRMLRKVLKCPESTCLECPKIINCKFFKM